MIRTGRHKQKKKIQKKPVHASIPNQFVNSLTRGEAEQLYQESIHHMNCIDHINARHIQPTLMNIDELKNMTGHKGQDGTFY